MEQERVQPRKKPGRKPGRTHTEQLKVMMTPDEMMAFVAKASGAKLSYSDAAREAIRLWRSQE